MGWSENKCKVCGKVIPSGLLKCLSCSLNLVSKGNAAIWRCRVCGARIDEHQELCSTCGTNLRREDETEAPKEEVSTRTGEFEEEYVCMICNHPVDRKARRCDFCGTVFQDRGGSKYGPVVERVERRRLNSRASPNAG